MRHYYRIVLLFLLSVMGAACQKADTATTGAVNTAIGAGPERYLQGRGPECVIKGQNLERLVRSVLGPEADSVSLSNENRIVLMGTPSDGRECAPDTVNYMMKFLSAFDSRANTSGDVAAELPNIGPGAGASAGSGMICGFATNAGGERWDFQLPIGNSSPAQVERFKNCVTGMAMKRRCFVYFCGI